MKTKSGSSRAPSAQSNPLLTRKDWERQRNQCKRDPGAFHGRIACAEIHWYLPEKNLWVTRDGPGEEWTGIDFESLNRSPVDLPGDFQPWTRSFNDEEAPFYRWFEGGQTNACFNEVDRHVICGYGNEIAFHFEGDRWDPSRQGGKGAPVTHYTVTRKLLLLETVRAAAILQSLGLRKGDRIALNMPNILEQIYYIQAAKRVGLVFTPVFGGFSAKTLSDRIEDSGAKVAITSDGGYRNAQIFPFKESYLDAALADFIPIRRARSILHAKLEELAVPVSLEETILEQLDHDLSEEITVERADVMRGVGSALNRHASLDPTTRSQVRMSLAMALLEGTDRVQSVIVVRHTRQEDVFMQPGRDLWHHDLASEASRLLLENCRRAGYPVGSEKELLQLPDLDFVQALYATSRPEPVDAEFPLFIIYTSGSTGKPKGVVHVHGGYVAGIAHTMKVSFDIRPGQDVIYVIADPGWITGQSYEISAALTTRTISIITEGSPVFPHAGRFASIIERHQATIFKAGVTFLKSVMSDPENVRDLRSYDMSSLRVATFCAEPVSPAVQEFGMKAVCDRYINSYWATEHGGIVWTHFYGNQEFSLRPDARTYPLPWIFGDVWVNGGMSSGGRIVPRRARDGEKGELVITRPYPYLARCIWGNLERFGQPDWKGDASRFLATYWNRWEGKLAYTQGDFARRYQDGSFSLHGRSDDVINVSGHRLGTEEIEGAILRDKEIHAGSPVGNVLVVGAPHPDKGLSPLAFVQVVPGRHLAEEDKRRLNELVRSEKGIIAVPEDYLNVPQFPETWSGKYMRRFLGNLLVGEPLGDTTTLKNPEALDEIRLVIQEWKDRRQRVEQQRLFERYRFCQIHNHRVSARATVALVTLSNPPVNALTERGLDELNTIVDHLARRPDVRAVIFTGEGTRSFVAGADVRQLLQEMKTREDVLPLSRKAHRAFRNIQRMSKPVIAAVNGFALGGGNEFQLAAHYRIAESSAEFGQPEIRLNLIPGYGATQRVPLLLHQQRGIDGLLQALYLLLNGRNLTASQALELGLVDEVSEFDVVTRAFEVTRQYLLDGQGPLKAALQRNRQLLATQKKAKIFPANRCYEDPEIQRILRQSEWAGRKEATEALLDTVRHGWERGFKKGTDREAEVFARLVVSPSLGRKGIRYFLEKRSLALPTRPAMDPSLDQEQRLIHEGELLPPGSPFFPAATPLPNWQCAHAAVKNPATGEPDHGDPIEVEKQILVPVVRPGPNQVLVYVLASEINFNDIWAITGIPVSPFDSHDQDYHITGSGGVGLVAAVGSEARREGRVRVGDLVTLYSGQNQLLSPLVGLDPMFAEFLIQGYEGPDGSHQQFVLVQAPQVHLKPPDLTLEQAGSYLLKLGTVYRALFQVLQIEPDKNIFVEGAATGTGLHSMNTSIHQGLRATGLVSTRTRARFVESLGAHSIHRKSQSLRHIFRKVPAASQQWQHWKKEGEALLDEFREKNDGELADYVVSHAGERAFPRSYQLLAEGGKLAFYGASTGYHFTFLGKAGGKPAMSMLNQARIRGGAATLIYYGVSSQPAQDAVDQPGLEAIEAAISRQCRVVVVAYANAQRDFLASLGYGEMVRGIVSLEHLLAVDPDFQWPDAFPDLPDSRLAKDDFQEILRHFNERVFKPLGNAVGRFFRTKENPRGYPDAVIERAEHDALAVSTSLVAPHTGRVIYFEDMQDRRYSFYAPQVWMRQRSIWTPTTQILGSHLCNAYEVGRVHEMVQQGLLQVTDPEVIPFAQISQAHQAMWENRHTSGAYVLNHALPRGGIRSSEELLEMWSLGSSA